MRVALVADEDPGWGGIGTYTGILGHALRGLGHEVHLVLRGWEADVVEQLDDLIVHRVAIAQPSWRRGTVALVSRLYTARESLIFSARVARVVARIHADIVEAPEFHAAGLAVSLRARLDRRAPPVVVRLHSPSFVTAWLAAQRQDLDLRALDLMEAASALGASIVSAPSEAIARVVRRRWRVPASRVRSVPNPIDDELFTPLAADREEPGTILVVGRIERAKGQDVLLEALPAIREAVPGAQMRLIGEDGGAAEALRGRARALGLSDAVVIEGARGRDELPPAYRSASVCVVPSRFEAFPYACLEAMSCGRAVVASRVGGLPEALTDEADGLLVAPEDKAALAKAVSRLLGDEAERRRLGARARGRVLSSFAARAVAQRVSELYAEVAR